MPSNLSPSNLNVIEGLEPALPSSWYLEDRYFQLEKEHIFFTEWICAGREEELPNPGDHKVLDVYGESILLLRNREGELKARLSYKTVSLAGVPDMPVVTPLDRPMMAV